MWGKINFSQENMGLVSLESMDFLSPLQNNKWFILVYNCKNFRDFREIFGATSLKHNPEILVKLKILDELTSWCERKGAIWSYSQVSISTS